MKIASDQNSIEFGNLTVKFFPIKKVKRTCCLHCLLYRYPGIDCTAVPCRAEQRKDKKNGVFSIRELPSIQPLVGNT
jgi:hypothetical protein